MARSQSQETLIVDRLRQQVADLQLLVARLRTDVANIRHIALRPPGADVDNFLTDILSAGEVLSEYPAGTLNAVSAGSTGHPLVSAGGSGAPAFGALGAAGIGANVVAGAASLGGVIHIEENTIDTADMAPLAITSAELAESYYQESEHFDTFQGTSAYPVKTKAATGKLDATLVPPVESIAADAVDSDAILDEAVITDKIDDDAVTASKMENIATQTIVGRSTAGTGDREQLTASQARSVISVTATEDLGGDSIVLGLRRSGSWTAGQRIQGWTDTTDGFCRLRVPSGSTFEVTMVGCHIQNGSRSGTYAYRAGVTEYSDDTSTGSATPRYAVDSLEWTDTTVSGHYFGYKSWDGSTALASVTGGASISILPFLMSEASSPATTTSDNCHVIVVGRFV